MHLASNEQANVKQGPLAKGGVCIQACRQRWQQHTDRQGQRICSKCTARMWRTCASIPPRDFAIDDSLRTSQQASTREAAPPKCTGHSEMLLRMGSAAESSQ
eukprot:scaffold45170_cov32-Tisochrysis_lutea.AAC.4